MLRIMKNDWKRMLVQKGYLIAAVILTVCAVGAVILLTGRVEAKENIAVVQSDVSEKLAEAPGFRITYLKKEPPLSELIMNRYDGVAVRKEDGGYEINTIKNNAVKEELQRFLSNPSGYRNGNRNERRIGTNIIGYMMMFLLMQGALYARLFAEDKEKHMLERVAAAPLPFRAYLAGHGIFIWFLIVIPSFAVVAVSRLLGAAVGFTLLQYALLIGILAFLAVAFALFLNSFFCVADTANMIGSSAIVLTTILAGSFYSFSKEDTLFNRLLHILPQKDFMDFTDALEKGSLAIKADFQLGYVLLLSIVLFAVAVVKTRSDYVYK